MCVVSAILVFCFAYRLWQEDCQTQTHFLWTSWTDYMTCLCFIMEACVMYIRLAVLAINYTTCHMSAFVAERQYIDAEQNF